MMPALNYQKQRRNIPPALYNVHRLREGQTQNHRSNLRSNLRSHSYEVIEPRNATETHTPQSPSQSQSVAITSQSISALVSAASSSDFASLEQTREQPISVPCNTQSQSNIY